MSIITIEFQDRADKYIGWCEAAAGFGLAFGPAIGSLIYEYTSFANTFIIYGGFLLLGTVFIAVFLPQRTNKGSSFLR